MILRNMLQQLIMNCVSNASERRCGSNLHNSLKTHNPVLVSADTSSVVKAALLLTPLRFARPSIILRER